MRAGFLSPLVQRPGDAFGLRNATTGEAVATRLEPALDSQSRRRGLLGRDGLPEGVGLVIAPSNAVHTFFMRFPIDVMFVRRDGVVLRVHRAVPRRRLAIALRAFAVIEMAAGGAAKVGSGDRLELLMYESTPADTKV